MVQNPEGNGNSPGDESGVLAIISSVKGSVYLSRFR
jgi:hypothetical protein